MAQNKAEMSDKDRALQEALLQIDKKFGKGSVMSLGDKNARLDIEAVSTGSVSLDIACGIGGLCGSCGAAPHSSASSNAMPDRQYDAFISPSRLKSL